MFPENIFSKQNNFFLNEFQFFFFSSILIPLDDASQLKNGKRKLIQSFRYLDRIAFDQK
jgi:hypothetical protein